MTSGMTVTSTESNPTLAISWGTHGREDTLTAGKRLTLAQLMRYTQSTTFASIDCSSGTSTHKSTFPTSTTSQSIFPSTITYMTLMADPVSTTESKDPHHLHLSLPPPLWLALMCTIIWALARYTGLSPLIASTLSRQVILRTIHNNVQVRHRTAL